MYKIFYFLCLFTSFFINIIFSAQAQDKKILDSLTIVYSTTKYDTIRILALANIAYQYRNSKPDTSISLAQQALRMSKNSQYLRGQDESTSTIGQAYYSKRDYPQALKYYQESLKIREILKNKFRISTCFNYIGNTFYMQSNYPLALENYQKCLKIKEEINDKYGAITALSNIALVYNMQKNYPLTLEYYQKSLKVSEEINYKFGIASTLAGMGLIYDAQGNQSLGLEYYQKSLKISDEIGYKIVSAANLNNIGSIYLKQDNLPLALEYYQKSIKIKKEIDDKYGLAYAYNGLAQIYKKQNDYNKAIEYAQEGFKIAQEIKTLPEITLLSETLYTTYKLKGDYAQALNYFELAKQTNDSIFNVEKAKSLANLESRFLLEKKEKEFTLLTKDNELNKLSAEKKAKELEITKKEAEAEHLFALARAEKDKYKQDSLLNLAQRAKLEASNLRAQEEKKRLEQDKKDLAYQAEMTQQKQIRNTFLGLSFTLILIVILVVIGLRQKQKANRALQSSLDIIAEQKNAIAHQNDELQQYNEELHQTQEELATQRDMLQEHNFLLELFKTKITHSIRSAYTIQQAILPSKATLSETLGEYFILNRPKDQVSGDFYWVSQIGMKKFVIVADCTGHGVSGAFMTMIGNTLLDKIVKVWQITSPAEILEKLHQEILVVLRQAETGNMSGMDIGVAVLEPTTENNTQVTENQTLIHFAGAKRPLYYVKSSKTEVEKLNGTRKSIGGISEEKSHFINEQVILPQNSVIYLGSDGYTDQNDVKRAKFSEKRFLSLLSTIQSQTLAEQKQSLEQALDAHMQNTEQRDDILVVGIRV
jgi:serine phosphatase RsbU (regulator of sigma subunit)